MPEYNEVVIVKSISITTCGLEVNALVHTVNVLGRLHVWGNQLLGLLMLFSRGQYS